MGVRQFLRSMLLPSSMAGGTPAPESDFWYSSDPSSAVPTAVTPSTALKLSVVYASARLWSWTIAMMPTFLLDVSTVGKRVKLTEDPLWRVLHDEPNDYQTPFEFTQEVVAGLALRGEAFSEKITNRSGELEQLVPIHQDALNVDWLNRRSGRRRVYDVPSGWDGKARVLRDDQVWHPRLMSLNGGLRGASPIRICAQSIGLAMSAQGASEQLYRSGMQPSMYATSDQQLNDVDAEKIQARMIRNHGGWMKWGKPMVLGKGAKIEPLSITPTDAKLFESMNFGIADCARIWGVPLHLVQAESKDTSWGSGIEHLKLAFHGFTIAPLSTNIDQSRERSFLDDRKGRAIVTNLGALLKGDMLSRFQAYRLAMGPNNPWYTRNDARVLEDMDRDETPEGDEFMVATNNTESQTPSTVNPGGPAPTDEDAADALAKMVDDVASLKRAA